MWFAFCDSYGSLRKASKTAVCMLRRADKSKPRIVYLHARAYGEDSMNKQPCHPTLTLTPTLTP